MVGLWENFEKCHGTFSYFIRGGGENFSKKGGGEGASGKISKKSTLSLFCFSFVEEVGGW